MPLRVLQVLKLFFTYFSRYFVFCEANLPYDKVEERKAFCSSCNGANSFYTFYQCLFFHLSLSLSLSLLSYLFLINPVPFCVFTQHSILQFFFFRRLWSFYTSNHATYITHAVCKKLKFKRVLTLSLRMTAIWHALISMYTRTMQEDVPFLLHVLWNTILRKERWLMPYIDFSFWNIDNKLHAIIKN